MGLRRTGNRCQNVWKRSHTHRKRAGVAEMLGGLKEAGIRMAVVSSNTAVNVRAALGPDLSNHFETILGIDNAGSNKSSNSIHPCAFTVCLHPWDSILVPLPCVFVFVVSPICSFHCAFTPLRIHPCALPVTFSVSFFQI